MSLADEHHLGQKILLRLNHLVELIASASLAGGEEKRNLIEESRNEAQDLKWLLSQLLGNNEEYLRTAFKELLSQRLPDKDMLEIVGGLEFLLENNGNTAYNTNTSVKIYPELDWIEQGLSYLFPRMQIYKNYKYRGFSFDYYLPVEKLAIIDLVKKNSWNSFKEYICYQEGIMLVYLDAENISSSREVARIIKKQIAIYKKNSS